jgi:hypothetical protein
VSANTVFEIRDNREGLSNVTFESGQQPTKHNSPISSTDAGISIDTKGHDENASFPIDDSVEGLSKVTDVSEWHLAKHD